MRDLDDSPGGEMDGGEQNSQRTQVGSIAAKHLRTQTTTKKRNHELVYFRLYMENGTIYILVILLVLARPANRCLRGSSSRAEDPPGFAMVVSRFSVTGHLIRFT